MRERRRKFTPEFKDEAVKMVIESSRPVAEVAREIQVNEGTLGNWATPHPRPRASVLAGATAHPGRRAPHRHDLAPDQSGAGPAARDYPQRARRRRRADHRVS